MASGFTRQETLAMTGISSGKLSYLDQTGIVVPQKLGNKKHPFVVYGFQQVLQIAIINRLREKLSLQEIRKTVDFLNARGSDRGISASDLIFIDKELHLVEDDQDFRAKVLEASRKNNGAVTIHELGKMHEVISELHARAQEHDVLDFDKRIQGTLLAA